MQISKCSIDERLKTRLVEITYKIVGCMHDTYKELSPGLPEPVFQESLLKALHDAGYKDAAREYIHHPVFRGVTLQASIKMDILVPTPTCNVVVECKAIARLTEKERLQLFGYLRGTEFPIGLLVNFGTYPKAQIERYYYDKNTNTIKAF